MMNLNFIGEELTDEFKKEIKDAHKIKVMFLTREQAKRRINKLSKNKKAVNLRRVNIVYDEDNVVKHIFRG